MMQRAVTQKTIEVKMPRGGVVKAQVPVDAEGRILKQHLTHDGHRFVGLWEAQQAQEKERNTNGG